MPNKQNLRFVHIESIVDKESTVGKVTEIRLGKSNVKMLETSMSSQFTNNVFGRLAYFLNLIILWVTLLKGQLSFGEQSVVVVCLFVCCS